MVRFHLSQLFLFFTTLICGFFYTERLIALQNEHQERMVYQSQISEASIERNMIFTEQDLANAFRRQTIHREADFGMLGLPKETIAFDLTEMSVRTPCSCSAFHLSSRLIVLGRRRNM